MHLYIMYMQVKSMAMCQYSFIFLTLHKVFRVVEMHKDQKHLVILDIIYILTDSQGATRSSNCYILKSFCDTVYTTLYF